MLNLTRPMSVRFVLSFIFVFDLSLLLSLPINVYSIVDVRLKSSPISVSGESTRLNDDRWHSVYFKGREQVMFIGVDDDRGHQTTVKLNNIGDFGTIHIGHEQPETIMQSDGSHHVANIHSGSTKRNDVHWNTGSVGSRTGKNGRGRRASSTEGGSGKTGFIGMMQQLVFDGRELSELDDDDSPGSINRKDGGQVKSTAGIDVAGGPVTITSSDAYIVLRSSKKDRSHQQQQHHHVTSSAFSVYFQMKTTQTDGLVFASWLPSSGFDAGGLGLGLGQRAFVGLELSGGHLRYVFVPAGVGSSVIPSVPGGGPSSSSSQVISIRGPAGHQPINDHRWHDIAIVVTTLRPTADDLTLSPGERHSLHVDNASKAETLRLGSLQNTRLQIRQDSVMATTSTWSSPSPLELYVGGLPPALLQALPRQIKTRHGYQGCLSGFELNGEKRGLLDPASSRVPAEHQDHIRPGCSGPTRKCTTTSCDNGGQCIQQWDSYYCDCDLTSFTGPTCADDSVAYKFGDRGGGLIDFRFADDERPDTKEDVIAFGFNTRQTDAVLLRVTGATSNDFLEIELVDGSPYVVYNVGLMDHHVGGPSNRVDDNMFHVLRVVRSGPNATLTVDDRPTHSKHPTDRQYSVFNGQSKVEVGSVRDVSSRRLMRTFQGTIVGLVVNRLRVLDLAAEADPRVAVEGDIELDTKPLKPPSSSSASQSTRSPERHDPKSDVIAPRRNSTTQTSTRKQFHGNDLIYSGNGGDGDGDSECIPWNEELCPTDLTKNNEDALIVPTTDRARKKPAGRHPLSEVDEDDWSGSRSTVECLSDDDEDCQVASLVTASDKGRESLPIQTATLSASTSFTSVAVPTTLNASGRRASSRSTAAGSRHDPTATTVPFRVANNFTTTTRHIIHDTDSDVKPSTYHTAHAKIARTMPPSPPTPSPSSAAAILPVAQPSKKSISTSTTAASTTRSSSHVDSSSAVGTRPVVEPISTAPRPSLREIYSVPGNSPSLPSDQSPAAGLLDAAVPVNISLIAGVAVAVAILLCMLVYVVIKWSAPSNSGLVPGSGCHVTQTNGLNGLPDEKSALREFDPCHERSPPLYTAHNNTTIVKPNSPIPVSIYMGSGDVHGGKQRGDVKEWFV